MTSTKHANVWQELRELRRRLEVLEDAVISLDDKIALQEARKEFRERKTLSHEQVARKLL